MAKYLITYGNDGSFFITEASDLFEAVLALAKYTGSLAAGSFTAIYKKALKAMDTPSELVKLYNRFVARYAEIQAIYKISDIIYQDIDNEEGPK